MLVLHSYRRCPFAIRVRMTLEEKGIPYTVVEESLRAPSSALLAVNPSGKVPVLIVDGAAIPESAVITVFLEEKYPVPSLGSPGEWTSWCDSVFKPDLDLYKYKFAETEREPLLARLRGHLQKIEDALAKKDFLLGDFSLADIHVFPFYRQLSKCEGFAEHFSYEKANRWLERILARPSFARVMKKS